MGVVYLWGAPADSENVHPDRGRMHPLYSFCEPWADILLFVGKASWSTGQLSCLEGSAQLLAQSLELK